MGTDKGYLNSMKQRFGELIDSLQLPEMQKQFMHNRWLDQVLWMEGKAGDTQKQYYKLRLITIVGGVIVPALVGLSLEGPVAEYVRWIAFFIGLAVAISAAVEEFFHYGERWRHYRRTVELLKSEGWEFFQLADSYRKWESHQEAFTEFSEKVETIIQQDVEMFINVVSKEKKKKDGEGDGKGS